MKKLVISFLLIFYGFLRFAAAQKTTEHIKVDQFGYRPIDEKVAVIVDPQVGANADQNFQPGEVLEIREAGSGEVVFTGSPEIWKDGITHNQSGDKVWWFDFSEVQSPGHYVVYDPSQDRQSFGFSIDENIYSHVLKHAVRSFYYQRCGVPKTESYAHKWADEEACHVHTTQDELCRLVTSPNDANTEKDLSGGWHDAGDYNKYVNFTYSPLHSLLLAYQENPSAFLDNYNIPESSNGIPDLLDEVKWELDWLRKMQLEDGQVLTKVSVTEFQGESPPSNDRSSRYYGQASASSTRTFSSIMAHAYLVFTAFEQTSNYADTLLEAALLSWNWLEQNPGFSTYNNQGFGSANPELNEYQQMARQTGTAALLYAATGDPKFRNYFDMHYQQIHAYDWGYWYPHENTIQHLLLFYTSLPNATPEVAQNLLNNFKKSVKNGNEELMTAVNGSWDAYRAYLKDSDYVWGSNKVKSEMGNIFYNAHLYVNDQPKSQYQKAAQNYLHYMHGVNPFSWCYLSNMNALGAEKSINEIYHIWFSHNSEYDHAYNSAKGPAPGFLSGGVNQFWKPDASYNGPKLSPPSGQPIQKAYKDWNTSWPENSWEVTEPAIYYQASFIHLLSKFASDKLPENIVTDLEENTEGHSFHFFPNPPVNHQFYFKTPKNISINKITIFDRIGRVIWQEEKYWMPGQVHLITLDRYHPSGFYFIKGWSQEGFTWESKLFLQNK